MKHHWKEISFVKGVSLDRCILCNCERKIERKKRPNALRLSFVSYRKEGEKDFHRSRPECEDKINLKLAL